MSLISHMVRFGFCFLVLAAVLGCTLSGGAGTSGDGETPAVTPSGLGASVAAPAEPVTLTPFGLPDGLPVQDPGSDVVTAVPVGIPELVESTATPVVMSTKEPGVPKPADEKLSALEILEGVWGGVVDDEAVIEPVEVASFDVASEVGVKSRSGFANASSSKGGLPPEAGGLANPNNALLPLVYFEGYGVNPFVDADEDPLSTFSLDGDTASFEIGRLYLEDARLPPEDSVRVEEWVNSFDQGYGDVESGLGLFLDGGPSPYGEDGYRLVRVGVGAAGLPEQRDPVNLIVVLDVSGSMSADSRIGVAKRLISGILDQVEASDRVALITYGDSVKVVQPFVAGTEIGGIRSAFLEITPSGGTFVEGGIRKAYELAASDKARPARIVVVSDGVGNLGRTGPDSILEMVAWNVQRDAVLSTIGVGFTGNYNDVMLEVLANRGNGTYHYVRDDEAIREFLAGAVTGIFTEVARDARVQVEFNPEVVRKYRLIGYENRAVADEDFRDDRLDFGELGFARDVTALYELRLLEGIGDGDELLTARLRWMDSEKAEVVEISEVMVVGDLELVISDLPYEFRRAAAVAEFAELLRKSFWAQCGTLESVGELLGFEDASDRVLDGMLLKAGVEFEPFCKK